MTAIARRARHIVATVRRMLALGMRFDVSARFSHSVAIALLTVGSMSVAVAYGGNDFFGDSAGFYSCARMLAAGRLSEPIRELPGIDMTAYPPGLFTPPELVPLPHGAGHVWVQNRFVGWPLHMAVAAKAFGWVVGPILLLGLLTAGSVVLTYLLAIGLGLSGPWALTAAALVGLNPIVVLYSLVPMTDIASMFWCMAAITAAVWSRKRSWLMAVAGFGFAVALLVRPSNAVLLPSVLLFSPLRWKHLLWCAAGGLPVGAARLASNLFVFGTPFGNDLERASHTFAFSYVKEGLAFYGYWLSWLFGPLLLTLGIAGASWLAVRGKRSDLALWLWVTSFLFLYAACSFAREGWWLLRYLMPAFPGFFVAAARATYEARVALLRAGSHRTLRRAAALSLLGVWLWAFLAAIHAWREFDIPARVANKVPLSETVAWIKSKTPGNAVFAATQLMASALYFNTDQPFIHLDFTRNDPREVNRLRDALRRNRTPLYAIVWYREVPDLLALEPRRWIYLGEHQQWLLFRDG